MLENLDSEKLNESGNFSLTSFRSKLARPLPSVNLDKYREQLTEGESFPLDSNFNSNTRFSSFTKNTPYTSFKGNNFDTSWMKTPREFATGTNTLLNKFSQNEFVDSQVDSIQNQDFSKKVGDSEQLLDNEYAKQGKIDSDFNMSFPFSAELESLKMSTRVPKPNAKTNQILVNDSNNANKNKSINKRFGSPIQSNYLGQKMSEIKPSRSKIDSFSYEFVSDFSAHPMKGFTSDVKSIESREI